METTEEILDVTNLYRLSSQKPKNDYDLFKQKVVGATRRYTDQYSFPITENKIVSYDGITATNATATYKDSGQYVSAANPSLEWSDGIWLKDMKYKSDITYNRVPEWWTPGKLCRAQCQGEITTSTKFDKAISGFEVDLTRILQGSVSMLALRTYTGSYVIKFMTLFVGYMIDTTLPTVKLGVSHTMKCRHGNDPESTFDQIQFSFYFTLTKVKDTLRIYHPQDDTEVELAIEAMPSKAVKTRSKFVRAVLNCVLPQPPRM